MRNVFSLNSVSVNLLFYGNTVCVVMANPRKFSEKIALHNHRQAEETAEFEKVMKEVMEVKDPESGRLPASRVEGRSRTRSQNGPMRRPHERRLDTSPYYLSPPTDTGWRRTNSDSALHQSTMQGMMMDKNNDCSNRGWNMPMMNGPVRNHQDNRRPRSSCDIPSSTRVSGLSIHPSGHDPSLIQLPIANTGSLPDLTNVDFTSPIHVPLDQEHENSPYSSNMRLGLDNKNIVNMLDTSNYTQLPGLTGIYHHHHHQQQHQQQQQQQQQHQQHQQQQQQQQHQQQQQQHPQQQQPSTSPSPTLQQSGAYRSPRPSPQSSPSPGRHSAPCSPGAQSPLPNEYYLLNQQSQQFQQEFEQLSMLDPPSNMSYVDQSTGGAQQIKQPHQSSNIPNASPINSLEMSTDAGYYSTSPHVYPSTSPGLRTTPNTPTSLPEIILTDFSGDDGSRQLSSDFFAEESLRAGLGPLDFEEIQILNSSIGISEMVEDNFRLDHRS